MHSDSTLYIDESGDLGYGAGSHWFVLSGVIVRKCDEKEIRNTLSAIRTRLNLKTIHWRRIKGFAKKSFIVQEISKHDFVYINILTDTRKLDKDKLVNPDHVYNYMCKYLLERASWYLRDNDMFADIVLSARGTSKDAELITYITDKLINYPFNEIVDRFGRVMSKSGSEWDMLQLADICASTMYAAYEENQFGQTIVCYTRHLSNKIYKLNNHATGYGIKYLNKSMTISKEYYLGKIVCRK